MKRSSGAILIDVMVAAFVISIGLVPLAGLFIQVGRSGQWMNSQEQAVLIAGERMEQLHGQGSVNWSSSALAGEAASDFVEMSGIRFDRAVRIVFRTDLDPAGHLMEAEVCITWSERGQTRKVTLMTYYAVDTGVANMQ